MKAHAITESYPMAPSPAKPLVVWIITDMEGLSGVDHWDQCYDPDDESPKYRHGCEQLVADTNAAVAGCFDAGAAEVRVVDGHGRNRNKALARYGFDPRAKLVWIGSRNPIRWEGLDESVTAVACVGQHAMAGTLRGFLDHTQIPKQLCRFTINGEEHGEMSQLAMCAGHYGIPLVYASGDEALCEEARRLFPWVKTTPTKKGTGWGTCELYSVERVRAAIRKDFALALKNLGTMKAWKPALPAEISVEWAWSEKADQMSVHPGVKRPHARTVQWTIRDARDIYTYPNQNWYP
jgi:D-amino peptidase